MTGEVVSFESLVPACLSEVEVALLSNQARYTVTVRIGLRAISVMFSNKRVFDRFSFRYGDMAEVATEPDYRFYVVDDVERTLFWRDPLDVRIWPKAPLAPGIMSFFADNALMNDFFLSGRYVGLHAAVVRGARRLGAIVGLSTAGKTTTVTACLLRGMHLYSDERCVLLDGYVYPFPRALALRPESRRLLAAEIEDDQNPFRTALLASPTERDLVVRPSSVRADCIGGPPALLDALFILDGLHAEPSLNEVALHDVIPHLAESMWSAKLGLDRVGQILSEFRTARCYRLQLGSPGDTVHLLDRLLSA